MAKKFLKSGHVNMLLCKWNFKGLYYVTFKCVTQVGIHFYYYLLCFYAV